MSVCRILALAAAGVFAQLAFDPAAQASAMQAAEFSPSTSVHVGFVPIDTRRLTLAPPLMVSLGSPVFFGRTVTGDFAESSHDAGALAAYYAGRSGQYGSRWQSERWQFEDSGRNWHFRSGHGRDFWEAYRGHDHDQVGAGPNPPAVPIPPALWLFASGAAGLASLRTAKAVSR